MTKKVLLLPLLILALSGCSQISNKITIPRLNQQNKIKDNYTGSYYKNNYVWGGAMNLAWNDLNENILHEKLKLYTKDPVALETTKKLNEAVFSKNDLDEPSYYIKSGYGQKTVDLINTESRQKFPDKSFNDLELTLSDLDIISYAYFLKKVEYQTQFTEKEVKFNDNNVKGFYAKNENQKKNISIAKYWDDNKFIIRLKLKDKNDELFLAKGFENVHPKEMVDIINANQNNLALIDSGDVFEMPKLHLDYHRDYTEMIGKNLANKNFEEYFIGQMFENIKFDMDQKGAKVENEAVIGMMMASGPPEPKKIKQFIFDKPFWVIMKRANSQNPYFILGVNNSELTIK